MSQILKRLLDPLDGEIPAIAWILAGLVNGLFVLIWILLQWCIGKATHHFPLTGLDAWTLDGVRFLFAASTLIPIVLLIIRDTAVMTLRTLTLIKKNYKNMTADGQDAGNDPN